MPTVTLGSKTLKELQKKFKSGYTIESAGKAKFHVRDPDGNVVHSPRSNAPLTLDNTPLPSERKNIEAELRDAGILEETRRQRSRRETPEEKAAREKRIAERKSGQAMRATNRQAEIDALHDRLDAVLHAVGGLERPGMEADLSHIALMLENQNGNEARHTIDRLQASIYRVVKKNWVEPRYQRVWGHLAEVLEKQDDPITGYFDLVRQSRGLPEAPTGSTAKLRRTDWPFEVQLLPISSLLVDETYQRPPDWTWVRKTAASYDERLVGTIDVSTRRHERFAILDGQGRVEASKLVGKTSIWCSVYSGFSAQNEAAFFLHKNHDRRTMHPFYTWRAKVASGDADAIAVEQIVREAGYELALSDARGAKVDIITAVSSVEETYRRKREDGSDCLTPTLKLLRETTYQLPAGQNGILIRGLGMWYATYSDEELDHAQMVKTMTKRVPQYLIGRARAVLQYQTTNYTSTAKALVIVLQEEYNEGLARGKKLARKEVT